MAANMKTIFRGVELFLLLLALALLLNAIIIWRRRPVFHLNFLIFAAHLIGDGFIQLACLFVMCISSWFNSQIDGENNIYAQIFDIQHFFYFS